MKVLSDALKLSQPINSNSISVHMPRFCSLLQLSKPTQVETCAYGSLTGVALFVHSAGVKFALLKLSSRISKLGNLNIDHGRDSLWMRRFCNHPHQFRALGVESFVI